MSDLATLKALLHPEAEAWSSYRTNCAKALRFYRGIHRTDIEAALRKYFAQAMDREEFLADTTNFCRKIVDRAANLWDEPVDRVYFQDETALDEEDPAVMAMADQEVARGIALQSLDRRCYLCRSSLMQVGWDDQHSRLSYRVISPADVWIVRDGDSDDLQSLQAIIYQISPKGDTKRYCLWSHEWQMIYQGDAVDQPGRIEERADYRNPLGLLPFVIAREEDPEGRFFPPYAEDLVDTALQLNLVEVMQTANVWYQSHAPMIVPEGTETKQAWGRGVAWKEPAEFAGQTRFLTKDTPFTEVTAHIERRIRTLAMTRDLPPDDFALAGKAPESGFAKLIASLPLLDLRRSRIGRVGQPVEEQLVAVETAVLRYAGQAIPEDLSVSVNFPTPEFPRSEQEKYESLKMQIELHLTNPARILADEQGIPYEEALEQVEENKKVNEVQNKANFNPLYPPVYPGSRGSEGDREASGDRDTGEDTEWSGLG